MATIPTVPPIATVTTVKGQSKRVWLHYRQPGRAGRLPAARAAGLSAHGLKAPGHFLLQLEAPPLRALLDPFSGKAVRVPSGVEPMTAIRERASTEIKEAIEPVCDTDVLLRLENNLKLRAMAAGNVARAVEIAQRMLLVAPRRSELMFDLARLNVEAGSLVAARKLFTACLENASGPAELRLEAENALASLRRQLN